MSTGYHLDDEVQQRSYDSTLMARLLGFVRPYRNWMIGAVALLMIVALLSNINPVLIMWAVDGYISNQQRTGLEGDALAAMSEQDIQGLFWITVGLGVLILAEAIIRYAQLLIISYVGQVTMFKMRMDLFAHMQRLSLRFLDRNPVGRLMTRVTNDVEKIQQTIVTGVVQVVSDLLTLVVVLIFMFAINWQLALISLLPLPFIIATSWLFRRYAQKSFLEVRRRLAMVNSYLQENVGGMRVIQLFGREKANFGKYRELNAGHRDEWLRQVRNFALYFPTIEFLGALSIALIILYCGTRMLDLETQQMGEASFGTIFAFVFLAERFFGPIRSIADRYNLLLEAMASSERVFGLLDAPIEVDDKPDAKACGRLRGEVRFENVRFAYDEPEWVIKDLNLDIHPGERVAIVGHTGAGKSTIINLLTRFYDVQQGRVLVDGMDVRDYEQETLRRQIGIVLQDVFLFSGTVEENIRMGDLDMSEEWIRECAAYVNASRFIEKLPGQYQYHVGERGTNLSTGQRQLLAFARTLAHKPSILVLDEATSSIDTETEMLIQDAIGKLMDQCTSVVIAHRLSTVQHAGRIVVMHHGELREMGAHQELLAQGGLYRTLYELQYKGQTLGPAST